VEQFFESMESVLETVGVERRILPAMNTSQKSAVISFLAGRKSLRRMAVGSSHLNERENWKTIWTAKNSGR